MAKVTGRVTPRMVRSPATASSPVNRKGFGLTWNTVLETGSILVGDDVTITLDVQLPLDPAATSGRL
jgi:polyisoprenoid-binding protein YceI